MVYILVTLLHLWYTYWLPKVKCNELNDELLCIAKVLKLTDMTMFTGIYNYLKLLAISGLRRLKKHNVSRQIISFGTA